MQLQIEDVSKKWVLDSETKMELMWESKFTKLIS